jgi:hypothetical protein
VVQTFLGQRASDGGAHPAGLLASASTRRLRVSIGSAPLARMSRCSRFLDDLGIGDVMDQLIGPVTLRVADPVRTVNQIDLRYKAFARITSPAQDRGRHPIGTNSAIASARWG